MSDEEGEPQVEEDEEYDDLFSRKEQEPFEDYELPNDFDQQKPVKEDQFVPHESDAQRREQRPEYKAVEAQSRFDLGAMAILLFGHVNDSIPIPALFDNRNRDILSENIKFEF